MSSFYFRLKRWKNRNLKLIVLVTFFIFAVFQLISRTSIKDFRMLPSMKNNIHPKNIKDSLVLLREKFDNEFINSESLKVNTNSRNLIKKEHFKEADGKMSTVSKRTNFYEDKFSFDRKKRTLANCVKLFKGDKNETMKVKTSNYSVSRNYRFDNLPQNCKYFISERNYITSSLTKEEEMFPIAYNLIVFKDSEQVERLLRAIYRPQNIYCIHIDKKSKESFRQEINNISSCFDNVFITKQSVDVQWGTFSVLEPELLCMKDLLKYKKWKYLINLTGQDFPLRTNYELVKILKIYNGANDMEGTIKRANKDRWQKAGKPPHGIVPIKGSIHIAANRDFIDYAMNNETAKDFLEWVKTVGVPDEVYFASLNHNPQLKIRGSYKGEPETNWKTKPFLVRFKNWYTDWPCHGKWVRTICVFGVGDLPLISERPELFANKFHYGYQPLALDCLEELHYNRTRDEYLNKFTFNTTFYENLEFIKNVV